MRIIKESKLQKMGKKKNRDKGSKRKRNGLKVERASIKFSVISQ